MRSKLRFIAKTMAAAVVLGLATFAAVPSAHASELDFSYKLPTGNVLSGVLDGTLLSNGNTFDVTSVDSLFVNGAAVPLPTHVVSADDAYGIYGVSSDLAAVSLNGSYMNLYASYGNDAFEFAVGDAMAAKYWGDKYEGATPVYGGQGTYPDYNPADWSASIVAPVATTPEPSSFVLLGTGVLGLAGATRRKFRQA
jgi:hypothetical protein